MTPKQQDAVALARRKHAVALAEHTLKHPDPKLGPEAQRVANDDARIVLRSEGVAFDEPSRVALSPVRTLPQLPKPAERTAAARSTHTDEPSHVARVRLVADDEGPADAWKDSLICAEKVVGRGTEKRTVRVVLPTLANVVTILSSHPDWQGKIAYDAFSERIELLATAPWHDSERPTEARPGEWTDTDTARTLAWFERDQQLRLQERTIEQAIPIVAERNLHHPVRSYLRGLRWDGRARLDNVLSSHFSAQRSEYASAVGLRWFVSAVARVMKPGCQADCTLVLESASQGWFKTSAFRALVPVRAWYSDTGIDIGNKDSMQTLHGVWLYGLDELDSLSRSEITRTKTFLTQTVDRFRPPFGRRPRDYPRQNVFGGTTNSSEYLTDRSGNRRFWPVRLLRPIDPKRIEADRDQLWAEAVALYDRGTPWHVDTRELRVLCEAEQGDRVADDAWLPLVADWLASPSVTLPDPKDGRLKTLTLKLADGITTSDVLIGALRMAPADLTRPATMRVAEVLKALGFDNVARGSGKGPRLRRYRRSVEP